MRILNLAIAFAICATPCWLRAADLATATIKKLSASDLAAALELRWWSYKLQFNKPISGVTARLVEMRRNSDGKWQSTPLSGSFASINRDRKISEAEISLVVSDKLDAKDFMLRLGGDTG